MSKLTKAAKGKECYIRIYPHCNCNPETTVFCHAPSVDKGMSIKSPDWWGSFGCSTCHAIVDGSIKVDLPKAEINACLHRGIYLTQKWFFENGLLRAA